MVVSPSPRPPFLLLMLLLLDATSGDGPRDVANAYGVERVEGPRPALRFPAPRPAALGVVVPPALPVGPELLHLWVSRGGLGDRSIDGLGDSLIGLGGPGGSNTRTHLCFVH